jgi:hypothetical protein
LPHNLRGFVAAFFLGLWIYSLILWGWVALNFYLMPNLQYDALSVYIPIKRDLVADIAFPVSFIGFVFWSYLRDYAD